MQARDWRGRAATNRSSARDRCRGRRGSLAASRAVPDGAWAARRRIRGGGSRGAVRRGGCALSDAIGTLYSAGNDQKRALAAYDRAVALEPQNPQFLYNRASVRRFLGILAGAEEDYDRVIALQPSDLEAYKNRTDLRTQTAERNHVAELEAVARASAFPIGAARSKSAIPSPRNTRISATTPKSFENLARAARRSAANICATTSPTTWRRCNGSSTRFRRRDGRRARQRADAHCGRPPVTLRARPFSSWVCRAAAPLWWSGFSRSHSTLYSAGELDCFALSLVDAVRRRTGRAQMPRRELVASSAHVDFAALGRDYLHRARAGVRRQRPLHRQDAFELSCIAD